ncbi:four-helix bundle copper-binding protein [Aquibacillus salsiterrae]|uniref:Four-helix bundle copper-binding protein n=1 Tax=Aquibacillus salsiterrae TaxID=2950439 RepID=A0A9X3WFG5_9BACI|nr:four-helix bundle copper-binding protein [Aquibacillus salsiterrae]MDC3417693.1 four-helix bundle copper-binding protein [Aquibacillus salsiterrae]
MPHSYNPYQGIPYEGDTHHHLLMSVQHCEATCEQMISMLVTNSQGFEAREQQIQLLRDCSDICTLMAKYLARGTNLSLALANTCAYICEICGTTCSQFPDYHSQHCAQTCLNFANECKALAG